MTCLLRLLAAGLVLFSATSVPRAATKHAMPENSGGVGGGRGLPVIRGVHRLGSGWSNGMSQASDVLVPGTPAQSAFEGDGGTEVWTLIGEAGEVVRIELTSEAFDTSVELVAPSGEVVARSDYTPWRSRDAQVIAVLPASGRYEVHINGEGEYNVEASIVVARELAVNRRENAILERDGVAAWIFYGQKGTVVAIDAGASWVDTQIQLHGPSGTVISADEDSGVGLDASLVTVLPVSGRYVVLVTSDGRGGSYHVEVRGLEARMLTLGRRIGGTLNGGGAVEIWSFDAEADGVVRIDVDSMEFDPYISLMSPTGEEIGSDDDSGGGEAAQLAAVLPVSGRYHIVVALVGYRRSGGEYHIEALTFTSRSGR